jgi:hypothetical protein
MLELVLLSSNLSNLLPTLVFPSTSLANSFSFSLAFSSSVLTLLLDSFSIFSFSLIACSFSLSSFSNTFSFSDTLFSKASIFSCILS